MPVRKRARKTYTTPKRVAKKTLERAKVRSTKKMIRNVLLKQSETKFTSYAYALGALSHNTGTGINLWTNNSSSLFPTVGDTENNRDGNEIISQGFMIRGMFNIPYDRRDVRIDYYFVQYNTNMGAPETALFHNVTGNCMLDPINKKRWDNVKKLGTMRVKATDAPPMTSDSWIADNAVTKTVMFKKWIPLKKKLKFYADSSSFATNVAEFGKIVFFVYDTLSTAGTDTVVHSGSINATFYIQRS